MFQALRDWWRGYSDADLESVAAKLLSLEAIRVGGVIPMTAREMAALSARPDLLTLRHQGLSYLK